jgi:uncharacterized membrane protein
MLSVKAGEKILRWCAALFFVIAGANHFRMPESYLSMMPPGFPRPAAAVAISGIAEILGGIGILPSRTRRLAGWGLIALLVTVFPANLYCALIGRMPGFHIARWVLWLRLPFQLVFVLWVWAVSLRRRDLPD